MPVRITGKIIRGEGNAGKNNSVLIPLLAVHFPEIANCSQFGTINVQLHQPLDKSRADVWTELFFPALPSPRIIFPVILTGILASDRIPPVEHTR